MKIPLFLKSPKFKFLHKAFGKKPFKLLDVGIGNGSARKTKELFPNCEYHGIDLDLQYNNTEEDIKAIDRFYAMDVGKLNFDEIPDNYFDGMLLVHIIEHLQNGDEVLKALLPKLKIGGYIYLEYPSSKSINFPGQLNFYNDDTHVRVYTLKELRTLFRDQQILKSGVRRDIYLIMALPFRWLFEKPRVNMLWDLWGFAEYLWIRRAL